MTTQKELEQFVNNNVFCNVSLLLETCFEKEIVFWDDIANLEYTEEELLDQGYTPDQIENGDAQTSKEIFEWYQCSAWLIEELKARGEPILESLGNYWGRTCTGQAIYMDGVIEDIYNEIK